MPGPRRLCLSQFRTGSTETPDATWSPWTPPLRSGERVFQAPPIEWIEERVAGLKDVENQFVAPSTAGQTLVPSAVGSCPECDGSMFLITFKDTRFLGCTKRCGYTHSVPKNGKLTLLDRTCESCG